MTTNTIDRFTNRVANYVKYRPGYPPAVLQLFKDKMNLTEASIVADVGSGPGISARMFLENGNKVYGVEPNAAMRKAAEEILKEFPNFRSINGNSEETTLPASSVDFVMAAQAFHWFKIEPTRIEFQRILKPGGYVALIWNLRQVDSTPFLKEYEQFILDYANDYQEVRHANITGPLKDSPGRSANGPTDRSPVAADLMTFFSDGFEHAVFKNIQVFDFEGLRGRLFSASYMPAEDSELGAKIEKELNRLFTKHASDGRIEIFYDTNIFYSKW
jgi:SAM-dependent methyltransferase